LPNPRALIRAGAKWAPGSWTPARCALWHSFEDNDMRKRLETWVNAERERGRCHKDQLLDIEGESNRG